MCFFLKMKPQKYFAWRHTGRNSWHTNVQWYLVENHCSRGSRSTNKVSDIIWMAPQIFYLCKVWQLNTLISTNTLGYFSKKLDFEISVRVPEKNEFEHLSIWTSSSMESLALSYEKCTSVKFLSLKRLFIYF